MFEGWAVESQTGKQRARINSKEKRKAGRNNRSLAQEETSVTSGEWELFVTEWFPFVFYKIPSSFSQILIIKPQFLFIPRTNKAIKY